MTMMRTRDAERDLVRTVELRADGGDGGEREPFDLGTWLTTRGTVPVRRVISLAVAWPVVYAVGLAVEPRAADPDAAPAWVAALGTVFLVAAVVAVSGFVGRTRLGMLGSFFAGGTLLALAIACPTSGHHVDIGPWWAVQLTGASGLTLASLAGLRR